MKRRFWTVLLSLVAVLCLTFALTACGGGKTECEKDNHEFETAWTLDATNHWHKCKNCDEIADKAAHVYDKEVVADEYRASEATYTEPAKYYKSCVCGAKGTETFNNGNTLSAQDNQIKLKSGVMLGKTYDGAAYSLSADKFTFGGNGALTFEYKSEDASDWSASAPVNAGDYKVRVSVAATAEWKAAQATFDFAIAKKQLTISGTTVADKVYDGTAEAAVTAGTLEGLIGNDDGSVGVTATGIFASKDVAYEYGVVSQEVTVSYTLTGDPAKNYLAPVGETLRATINQKPLLNVNLTKVYDGHGRFERTALTVEQGMIAGENIKIYVDAIGANVGVYKDGNEDGDFDFNEYVLYIGDSDEDQTVNYAWGDTCTATITKKPLVVDFTVDDKYYDGTTKATIADGSLAVSGIVDADEVTVTPTATFEISVPGNDVTVNVTFALSGTAAGNYCVEDTTVTAEIIAVEFNINSVSAVSGQGTVLFGTLAQGEISKNDTLILETKSGEKITVIVKGIMVDEKEVTSIQDSGDAAILIDIAKDKVAAGDKLVSSMDVIKVNMSYDNAKGYYTTGNVDFGKTVYANVELADAEWTVLMDTGVATYKVYDSKGAEITVVNGVFTLGASDTVTLVFTPVGSGGVDACSIQQKK